MPGIEGKLVPTALGSVDDYIEPARLGIDWRQFPKNVHRFSHFAFRPSAERVWAAAKVILRAGFCPGAIPFDSRRQPSRRIRTSPGARFEHSSHDLSGL